MGWFYVITDEMISWGLTGSELLVFALINGYSQRGQGCYFGSLDTTAEVTGISRATAARTLQSLEEKGFIKKSRSVINENFCTIYSALRVSKCESQNETAVSKCDSESLKMRPYNRYYNKYNTKRENIKDFTPPTLDQVKTFCSERNNGIDPEEFIAFYASKGWMVGKSKMKDWKSAIITWEKSRKKETPRRAAPTRQKESVFEHNLRVADEMFGTDLHQQAYGRREVYDEQ